MPPIKGKYYGQDVDADNLDDQYEIDVMKRHSPDNKPHHPIKHFNVGGLLNSNGAIIEIHHDNLSSTHNHKLNPGKMVLTMREPRPMSLKLDITIPNLNGMDMNIKIPSAVMDDSRIKSHKIHSFNEDWINRKINRILNKNKKVRI
jgi:hypothetical protein